MSQVNNAVKQKLISDYIKTPQGRVKLAASMTQPLRLRRDYTSVGRKTFLVEHDNAGLDKVLKNARDVGIISGASAPQWLVKEIVKKIKQYKNK